MVFMSETPHFENHLWQEGKSGSCRMALLAVRVILLCHAPSDRSRCQGTVSFLLPYEGPDIPEEPCVIKRFIDKI